MFSWRLLLATGRPQHADLVERTLFNVVATAVADAGTAFFYANTLHQREPATPVQDDVVSPRAVSSLRAPWFAVSCCPTNVARTLAGLARYVATADDDGVQLHQYAPAAVRTTLPDGRPVAFDVETEYPRDGVVRVRVRGGSDEPWTLTLRVPAWASGARLRVLPVGGTPSEQEVEPGSTSVRRAFADGDVVELHLPVAPRLTAADPRVDAVRGCVAVERGPEVLCLESVDLATATDGRLDDVADVGIDPTVAPREVDGAVVVRLRPVDAPDGPWPYGPPSDRDGIGDGVDVPLVVYHDWAERGPSTMRVWIPTTTAGS
jgi:DUF1680 family protein